MITYQKIRKEDCGIWWTDFNLCNEIELVLFDSSNKSIKGNEINVRELIERPSFLLD